METDTLIKEGDVVTLITGSPQMTVQKITGFNRKTAHVIFYKVEKSSHMISDKVLCENEYAHFTTKEIAVAALKKVS